MERPLVLLLTALVVACGDEQGGAATTTGSSAASGGAGATGGGGGGVGCTGISKGGLPDCAWANPRLAKPAIRTTGKRRMS